MTGGLAQAQQRFENLHPRVFDSDLFDAPEERVTIVCPQFIVQTALLRFEFAIDGLFRLGRQFARDLLFGSPQQKWTQRFRKEPKRIVGLTIRRTAGASILSGDLSAKNGGRAKQPRIQEFEETPQITQAVFYRRPC